MLQIYLPEYITAHFLVGYFTVLLLWSDCVRINVAKSFYSLFYFLCESIQDFSITVLTKFTRIYTFHICVFY